MVRANDHSPLQTDETSPATAEWDTGILLFVGWAVPIVLSPSSAYRLQVAKAAYTRYSRQDAKGAKSSGRRTPFIAFGVPAERAGLTPWAALAETSFWRLPDLAGIRDLNSQARDGEPTISPPVPAKRKTHQLVGCAPRTVPRVAQPGLRPQPNQLAQRRGGAEIRMVGWGLPHHGGSAPGPPAFAAFRQ